MIRTLTVNLYGKAIGVLKQESDGYCSFQYTPEFCTSGLQVSPLMMPSVDGRVYRFQTLGRETFCGLPGMTADSLPDSFGQALLNQWLVSQNRSAGDATALEKLSYMGKRCMGALEYVPSREQYLEESSVIELTELVETARKALSTKENFATCLRDKTKAITDILRIGTSAGGQRAKAVIALNDVTGEIRSGQIEAPDGFGYWLLKFDGFDSNGITVAPANYGRIEFAFSKCVMDAGIGMNECRLLEESGRAHFMTRRFDRNGKEKKHMQTLCAIAHYDFRMPGAYSYEQAFRVLRMLNLGYEQATELYRRMVFNIMAVNMDDHTKNISFLMDRRGKWCLSPAYDMGFCYNPDGQWANSHQMTVNGKRNDIDREDVLSVASSQDIKRPEEILEQVEYGVMKFPFYAKEIGVSDEEIKQIMVYITRQVRNLK